jgi:hypothetical protein
MIENLIRDFQKKDISKEDRADIIRRFIKEKHTTAYTLCRNLGIPKTTMHVWLHPGYRTSEQFHQRHFGKNETELDYILYQFSTRMKIFMDQTPKPSPKTMDMISDAKNIINVIETRYRLFTEVIKK